MNLTAIIGLMSNYYARQVTELLLHARYVKREKSRLLHI